MTKTIDEYTLWDAIKMMYRFEVETGIDPWWPTPVTDDKPDWKSYLEQEYKKLCLPDIYHYCIEKHKFNEHWSGIWKKKTH